jgi:hypothetical protein
MPSPKSTALAKRPPAPVDHRGQFTLLAYLVALADVSKCDGG